MKTRRTIAGVLACAMLTAAISVQTSAADAVVTLSAEKVQVQAGSEFSVNVSLTDVPASKINVIDFAVDFDADALDVTNVTLGEIGDVAKDDPIASEAPVFAANIQNGQIAVSWTTALSSDNWIAGDGVLLTITGTVKKGTADGTYPLKFVPVTRDTYDGSGEPNTDLIIGSVFGADVTEYTVKAEDGAVVVGDNVVVTTSTSATETTDDSGTTTTEKPTTETTEKTTDGGGDVTDDKGDGTTATTQSIPLGEILYGDVNLDAKIDLTDAILLNKACAGTVQLNDKQRANADVTADGDITSNDPIALLRFLVHIIDSLPGE